MRIPWRTHTSRQGFTVVEATVALSMAAFTVAITMQLLVSAKRGHQLQTQRAQALRELDNALEMAFWLDASQLEDKSLEEVARTTAEGARAAGTAPEELTVTMTIADDSSMPPRTKRIDAVASYRERSSGSIVTLPTLSIWRVVPPVADAAAPESTKEATP